MTPSASWDWLELAKENPTRSSQTKSRSPAGWGCLGRMESQNPVRLPLQSGLILYALGEESVLFSTRSRQLYGLDRTTTLALLRLEDGEEAAAVSRDLGLGAASCQVLNQLSALLAGRETGGGEYELHLPCPLKVPAHRPGLH